ncbi:MAG: hypothetical protein A3D67_01240 [Candidatus Lloydbacteria bacterium RIFCSPHIGHO2_02_FULL_51_22]|uniref:Uncharacterized protein n=2 Tax=Candidatus Lloydiibacteriota TaxID=1817910 RepID=A0A1G2D8I1_9BACT|nr:MAG: hypothetical protein A3D67_01240 [Candidatus Lloydbacteria bacterium RIFCSPHIGHO2_02_FULL_51_22]OGZ15852.1 MAG: hypothetical protein A3J08_03525 [Candidatus Lloydbacteria bacterium RIFCSPLOWO2_02_FULL_51_11]
MRTVAKSKKLVVAEVSLIVASVFIFRGLWTLLDRASFMNGDTALWASIVIGIAASIPALRYIIRNS